ncbi:YopX family protein, partial [Enterococcus faecium]
KQKKMINAILIKVDKDVVPRCYIVKDSKLISFQVSDDFSEIMQATGLSDLNNKEIFEGDILYRKVYDTLIGDTLGKWLHEYVEVEWKNGGWFAKDELLSYQLTDGVDKNGRYQTAFVCVGNIYENHYLIEV